MSELKREVDAEELPIDGEFARRRRMRSNGPVEAAPTPLFEEPMPKMKSPSIMDRFREESPKLDHGSDMRAILAGATPLLAGFLGGNMGDAYEIASKGLLAEDVRRTKQDESLLGVLKAQAVLDAKKANGRGGSSTQRVVSSPNGDGRQAWAPADLIDRGRITQEEFDRLMPAKREYILPGVQGDIAAARTEGQLGTQNRYGLLDKPVTGNMGEPLVRNTKTGEVKPAIPASYNAGQAIPWKSASHQTKAATEVSRYNARVKPIQESLAQADVIITSAAQKEPESDSFMVFSIARLAAGPGQLSDQERMAFTGGKSLSDWVKVNAEKAKSGKLPVHIRERIVNLAKKIKGSKADRLKRIKDQAVSKTSRLVDLTPEQFESLLIDESAPTLKKPVTELTDEELEAELNGP